jgi:hypothetical protein
MTTATRTSITDGYMIGYVVLIIYTMGTRSLMLYHGERRSEYSVWLHTVFPILSTLGCLCCCSRWHHGGDLSSAHPGLVAPSHRRHVLSACGSSAADPALYLRRAATKADGAAEGAAERPATEVRSKP